MKKIDKKYENAKKALESLEKIYLKPHQADRSNIDATIQRFEFTFELFWKLLKVFFYEKGLELNYPKDVLIEAYETHILDDQKTWLSMLQDRNLTSHTYDEALADAVFARIQHYVPVIRIAFDKIDNMLKNI